MEEEELEIVKRVALSSMPYDRYKFFNLLVKYGGRLAGETIEHELGCSNSSAHRTMNAFGTLGIVDIKDLPLEDQKTGRPLKFIELKKEFSWILSYTQSTKYEKKSFSQENVSVSNLVVEHAYVQTAFSWF